MPKFKFNLLLLLLCAWCMTIMINACTSPSHSVSQQDDAIGVATKSQGFGTPLRLPDGLSTEKWMVLDQDYNKELKNLDRWVATTRLSQDWRSLDKSGKNIISDFQGNILAFQAEQVVAYTMIRGVLLSTPQSSETCEAMGYYMNVLLKNKWTAHAKTLVEALEYLRGSWGDEKVQSFATEMSAFREEQQLLLLKNQPSSEEEYLRRRAKNTVEANPGLFAGQANAEERLLSKLKQDRDEARKKSQSPEIAEQLKAATMLAMAEEQEQELYLQKLNRIAKTK